MKALNSKILYLNLAWIFAIIFIDNPFMWPYQTNLALLGILLFLLSIWASYSLFKRFSNQMSYQNKALTSLPYMALIWMIFSISSEGLNIPAFEAHNSNYKLGKVINESIITGDENTGEFLADFDGISFKVKADQNQGLKLFAQIDGQEIPVKLQKIKRKIIGRPSQEFGVEFNAFDKFGKLKDYQIYFHQGVHAKTLGISDSINSGAIYLFNLFVKKK